MKCIQLSNGMIASVDDDDFPQLIKFKWFAHRSGLTNYASFPQFRTERAR